MTEPIAWERIIDATPREMYMPRVVWWQDEHGRMIRVDRDSEPAQWHHHVRADVPLVTQLDDGGGSGHDVPTSSVSRPSLVAGMLNALDVRPGHRVLELGTGTGWTTALLCSALGAENVTTVEIDPHMGRTAARTLNSQGWQPTAVIGDGLVGDVLAGLSFDRVIATMAVRRIPAAWIRSARPGAIIVTPWGTAYNNSGLLRLVVRDNGSAMGTFVGNAAFMFARSQRRRFDARGHVGDVVPDSGAGRVGRTTLDPCQVMAEHADFAIGLRLPDVEQHTVYGSGDRAQEFTTWYVDGESWAKVEYRPGERSHDVAQGGPRSLWDEIVRAHEAWVHDGMPRREEHGVTVSVRGEQSVWSWP